MNIEGDYSFTITMSASCTSLPTEVKQRRYAATIREPQKGYVIVTLSGAEFAMVDPPYYKAGFDGERTGDAVHFVVDDGYGAEYTFVELIDGSKGLSFSGAVIDATVGSDRIAGTMAVTIHYFDGATPPQWFGSCAAVDHAVVFERQAKR